MNRAERERLADAYGAAEARLQRAQAARDRCAVALARDELRELERVISAVLGGEATGDRYRQSDHHRSNLPLGLFAVAEEGGDASTTSTPLGGTPTSDEGL